MTDGDLAFGLLRGAIDGAKPSLGPAAVETRQWWSLFKMMQRHHVVALTYEAAARCEVPREVLMPWLSEREKAVDWHRYQQSVLDDILGVLQRNGIETMVLKGVHTAQYYPQPELREFGDLDLYFYGRHDEADAVAQRELKVAVNNKAHHHTRYEYRGLLVESHYDFFNRHYPASNRRYNKMLQALAPSPTFDVLHSLRHAAIHFAAERINLRDVADWCLTCRALRDQADWDKVGKAIDTFGMGGFASALNALIERRLGYATPLAPANGPDSQAFADALERDILQVPTKGQAQGNRLRQWRATRWKRQLAFGDNEVSLLAHKTLSHLTHKH